MVAVIVSVIVHSLLIWVMATRLAGGIGSADPVVVDLGALETFNVQPQSSAPPSVQHQQVQEREAVEQVQTTELETSLASTLPPEWSVSRINKVAQPAPDQQQQPMPLSTSAPGKGGSGGASDTLVFDPYAGAAPQPRDAAAGENHAVSARDPVSREQGVPIGTSKGPELDRRALEAVRRDISRLVPDGGTAQFEVRVSPMGVVLQADFITGSASDRAKALLKAALTGKRLFNVSGAGLQGTRTLKLPMLHLAR